MKILFIGDTCAKTGRDMISKYLQSIKDEYEIDVVIMNGENLAHGKGMNESVYREMMAEGVDFFTLGNHTFAKKEIIDLFESGVKNIVRPLNYPKDNPGNGSAVIRHKNTTIRVTNLLGTVFISHPGSSPFEALDELLETCDSDIHIVDIHAEATSEKMCMGHYFDGRVSAVLGTHTHVQTADERILPKGTGYITDVGMTGSNAGIIGARKEEVIYRMRTGMPARFDICEGEGILSAVVLTFDDAHTLLDIERVMIED